MANEISITISSQVRNGNLSQDFKKGAITITQNARESDGGVESVATSEEDLEISNITTHGFLHLRNIDATNYVTYGPKSGGAMVPFGKLKAGECAVLRLYPGITLRWQADTSAVKVEWLLYGD